MLSLTYIDSNLTDPLLNQILRSTADGVIAEGEGRVWAVNGRFLEMIGWKDPYSGEPLDTLIQAWTAQAHHPAELEAYFRDCRTGNDSGELRELQPHPGQFIEARYCPSSTPEGIPFRLWMFQEWKTSALAWVSHEIKNPLNAVLGFSELLTEALANQPTTPTVKEALRGLRVGTKHLQTVLTDVLDLSRLEAGQVASHAEWVSVLHFLSDLEALYRHRLVRRGLEFLVEAPGCEGLEVKIDPGRMTQVLCNLLSNALKFTRRGWVALRILHEGDSWQFVVEDSGVGIPVDQQERIFQPFVQKQGQSQRRFGGTGLGLAICRTLVEGVKGRIVLESEPGHGSRFSVVFDSLESRTAPTSGPDKDERPSGMTLLVADDEKTNHLLVRGFVRDLPVRLIEASDGLQAVELWKQHRPAVVLMDLRMPGLTGLEAARRIRAMDPEGSTKLLVMSATRLSAGDLADGRSLWSGALEKPFGKADLMKILSKHLTIVDDSAKSS